MTDESTDSVGHKPASPRFLFVHPHADLYGSDRVFLNAIKAVRAKFPNAFIEAVLPYDGPLVEALKPHVHQLTFEPLVVLRRADLKTLALNAATQLMPSVVNARRRMAEFDFIYINTIVAIDYLMAARFTGKPRLVHVHELPTGPEALAFSAVLNLFGGTLLFNSQAVRDAFLLGPVDAVVLHNGTADVEAQPNPPSATGKLRIVMLGRISILKGQLLLVEALSTFSKEERTQLDVQMVGDVYGDQIQHKDNLEKAIADNNLQEVVTLEPFSPNPSGVYANSDLVVVPSTKPESFGLVATEAMANSRPVIGSDLGGLREIIVDEETGLFFPAKDAFALAHAIRRYLTDRSLCAKHGQAGRKRFEAKFTIDHFNAGVANLVAERLKLS